jgi:protein TonB
MFDQRLLKITVAVLLFHVGLVWLIQSGLARKITEAVIAPEIMARIIPPDAPPKPAQEQPKPKPETPPKQVKITKPTPTPPKPVPAIVPTPSLPPSPTAIEAPPAPPAPPAPAEPPSPPAPVNTAPRVVGLGEIQCPPPSVTYPAQSRRTGETGKVVVRLTTDESGAVAKAVVASSSGSPRLDQAAVDAVLRMRCKPYIDNGRPVSVTAQQPVNFELN